MKYIPIMFSTKMVIAIIKGRKTMTRRIAKNGFESKPPCKVGDVLWVRETWTEDGRNFYYRADFESDWLDPCETLSGGYPIYCSYHPGCEGCMREKQRIHWRPSIHMPKKAARIFLRVTDVFLQHLSSIKEIHAQWEGVDQEPPFSFQPYTRGFIRLWDSLIPKSKLKQYGYGADPWVWVIMFERIPKPEGWPNV